MNQSVFDSSCQYPNEEYNSASQYTVLQGEQPRLREGFPTVNKSIARKSEEGNQAKEIQKFIDDFILKLNRREKLIIGFYLDYQSATRDRTRNVKIDSTYFDNNYLSYELYKLNNCIPDEYTNLISNYKQYLIEDSNYLDLKTNNRCLLYVWFVLFSWGYTDGLVCFYYGITDSLADNVIHSLDICHNLHIDFYGSGSQLPLDEKLKLLTRNKRNAISQAIKNYQINKLDVKDEKWFASLEYDELWWCYEYVQKTLPPIQLPVEYKISIDKPSLLEYILFRMDWFGNNWDRHGFINKLKKSMAQKRYRDNRKNTEIIDAILKKNTVRKLDYLAKEWRLDRIQTLEKLIEFGHENDSLFDD